MSDFVIWLVVFTGYLVFVPDGYPAASTVNDLIHDARRLIAFRCVPRIGRGERAETLGGALEIEAGYGGGTAVSLRLPARQS